MPHQRGQFWLRRFRSRAAALCGTLSALAAPIPATDFPERALAMLEAASWIPAHRFLFAELRQHLLGWPPSPAPDGHRLAFGPGAAPA